jgi:hypothetical protein
VEEVSWGQTVEIPSDGPQELIVEFRYALRGGEPCDGVFVTSASPRIMR